MFDVVIVGAGTSGLSAALVLGRARRQVLICGEGAPRNAPATHAHSFFSRDGIAPLDLLRIGHEQLAPYDSVKYRPLTVVEAVREGDQFTVGLANGIHVQTRRILLASGVIDDLPQITGLAELWGTSVFHCPYCHGWEARDQPLAVLGNDAFAVEQALLISQWGRDLVLCTNGAATLTDEDKQRLTARGIVVHEGRIVRLDETNGALDHIVFADSETLARRALFIRPSQHQRSPLAVMLGCTMTSPFPGMEIISTDGTGVTGIPGLYAAGDATTAMQQLVMASASGAMAAAMINRDLLMNDIA